MVQPNAERIARDGDQMILRTTPLRDEMLRLTVKAGMHVRLLSRRCRESLSQSLPNQDYAYLAAHHTGSSLCFCVCDGVGSSYKGDFAASYIATRLVAWLQHYSQLPSDSTQPHVDLTRQLTALASSAQEELCQHPIASPLGPLVCEVLEELRSTYGSETVFLAGRIDVMESPELAAASSAPPPATPARVLLCSLGNVSLQLYGPQQSPLRHDLVADDRNRWSSARGLRGELQCRTWDIASLQRLIVYTDGAEPIASALGQLDEAELRTRVERLQGLPANDDITILDIQWPVRN